MTAGARRSPRARSPAGCRRRRRASTARRCPRRRCRTPALERPGRENADRSTVRFCAQPGAAMGRWTPTMVVQNESASTHAAVDECCATVAATVDSRHPAPGGPVMIGTGSAVPAGGTGARPVHEPVVSTRVGTGHVRHPLRSWVPAVHGRTAGVSVSSCRPTDRLTSHRWCIARALPTTTSPTLGSWCGPGGESGVTIDAGSSSRGGERSPRWSNGLTRSPTRGRTPRRRSRLPRLRR